MHDDLPSPLKNEVGTGNSRALSDGSAPRQSEGFKEAGKCYSITAILSFNAATIHSSLIPTHLLAF
jgi:hypothetical protein